MLLRILFVIALCGLSTGTMATFSARTIEDGDPARPLRLFDLTRHQNPQGDLFRLNRVYAWQEAHQHIRGLDLLGPVVQNFEPQTLIRQEDGMDRADASSTNSSDTETYTSNASGRTTPTEEGYLDDADRDDDASSILSSTSTQHSDASLRRMGPPQPRTLLDVIQVGLAELVNQERRAMAHAAWSRGTILDRICNYDGTASIGSIFGNPGPSTSLHFTDRIGPHLPSMATLLTAAETQDIVTPFQTPASQDPEMSSHLEDVLLDLARQMDSGLSPDTPIQNVVFQGAGWEQGL